MQVRLIFFLFILGFAGLCFVNWYCSRGVKMTGRATVLDHQVTTSRFGTGSYAGNTGWNYYVIFQLADGEELTLAVFEHQFASLKKGQTGQLTWQGQDFCDFEPEDLR